MYLQNMITRPYQCVTTSEKMACTYTHPLKWNSNFRMCTHQGQIESQISDIIIRRNFKRTLEVSMHLIDLASRIAYLYMFVGFQTQA